MTVRAPVPDDAPGILAIAYAQGLPQGWRWPEKGYGFVVEHRERIVAFCCLYESVYGLVTEELWDLPGREGERALALLRRRIEAIAQELADEREEPVACGGLVSLSKPRHIKALKKRNYRVEAIALGKMFQPQRVGG